MKYPLIIKQSALCLLLSGPLLSPPLHATGIPTVDVANLAQQLSQYLQMLNEYDEILKQTGLNQEQLLNALKQYQQALREYDHLLRQAQQLKSRLDQKQWLRFWKEANRAYEHRPFEGIDIRAASFGLIQEGVEEADRRYGHVNNERSMLQKATALIGHVPDELNQSYQRANLGAQQRVQLVRYREENIASRQRIQATDATRLTLGDESELATMQLLVEQNQILIDQMAQLNEMQTSQLDGSNQQANEHNVNRHNAQMDKIQRAEESIRQGVSINESPLRP